MALSTGAGANARHAIGTGVIAACCSPPSSACADPGVFVAVVDAGRPMDEPAGPRRHSRRRALTRPCCRAAREPFDRHRWAEGRPPDANRGRARRGRGRRAGSAGQQRPPGVPPCPAGWTDCAARFQLHLSRLHPQARRQGLEQRRRWLILPASPSRSFENRVIAARFAAQHRSARSRCAWSRPRSSSFAARSARDLGIQAGITAVAMPCVRGPRPAARPGVQADRAMQSQRAGGWSVRGGVADEKRWSLASRRRPARAVVASIRARRAARRSGIAVRCTPNAHRCAMAVEARPVRHRPHRRRPVAPAARPRSSASAAAATASVLACRARASSDAASSPERSCMSRPSPPGSPPAIQWTPRAPVVPIE